MLTHRSLLEAYVRAKDQCAPELIDEIFQRDAVLSISTAASAVVFPPLVVGTQGIAQTLVTDFAARFSQCRTYYVCDGLPLIEERIAYLPWLVLMREKETASLRIGRGYYHWQFLVDAAQGRCISEMHIRIDHMALIADVDGDLLRTLQSFLPYPWLSPVTLDATFGLAAESNHNFRFLHDFNSVQLHWPQALPTPVVAV
jgi:hypothetical protein